VVECSLLRCSNKQSRHWEHALVCDSPDKGERFGGTVYALKGSRIPEGIPDHAFLWENGDLVDLNSLIPPDSPLELAGVGPLSQVAVPNINDRGEIVGIGTPSGCDHDISDCGHAFLLIPCDERHPNVEACGYSLVNAAPAAQRSVAAIQSHQVSKAVLQKLESRRFAIKRP
jgi:hypothetical protein